MVRLMVWIGLCLLAVAILVQIQTSHQAESHWLIIDHSRGG
jgi:hypothetical protein